MRELAYESVSGTPGTTAAITVAAITGTPAYPRLNNVAPTGSPIHYTVENSSGQPLCTGVGISTGANGFTRQVEYSHWDGTTYTAYPGTLYSLPSGCKIYASLSAATAAPLAAPTWNGTTGRWFEPGDRTVGTTTFTPSAAGRDHFWRFRNLHPHLVDSVAIHAAATGTIDVGIYEIDWSTGAPGKLLLGWQGVSVVAGMNQITTASRTSGSLAAGNVSIPVGDLYGMVNVSATSVTCGRTITNNGAGGSVVPDLSSAQSLLYLTRTNATSFGDSPTLTGRLTTGVAAVPALVFRGV